MCQGRVRDTKEIQMKSSRGVKELLNNYQGSIKKENVSTNCEGIVVKVIRI